MDSIRHSIEGTSLSMLFLGILAVVAMRYFVVAGLAYWVCRRLFGVRWARRRIQRKEVRAAQLKREIAYSVSTIGIFGLVGSLGMAATQNGWTLIYFERDAYGLVYFWLSFPLTIVVHDAYFYWAHRFMHWRPVYRRAHRLHHRSTSPTPFTAFAFHPLEAVVEAGIFLIFLFVVPLHILALAFFFSAMVVWNVYVHIGFEFLPPALARSRVGRWLGTPTHHDLHHEAFEGNYGLWLNLWDRWMGTNNPGYLARLVAVADRAAGKGRDGHGPPPTKARP